MLNIHPLEEQDYALIGAAEEIIKKNYRYGRHHIGAAVRTAAGKVFAAVHLEANVGRIAVCAEAMALGKAISEGENEFRTMVAVAHTHPNETMENCWVVSPCGMCRELISDYERGADVILPYQGALVKCNVLELLPEKYSGSSDV